MRVSSTKQFLLGKTVASLNGLLLTILAGAVGAFLVLFTTANAKLVFITGLFCAVIFILILLNWRSSPSVRNGIALTSILVAGSIIMSFISFGYLDKFLIMSLILLATTITISAVKITKKSINHIALISLGLSVYFFIQSFGYYESYFESISSLGESDLNNPNGMGMIMLVCFMLLDRSKLTINTFIRLFLAALAAFAMFNYGSRNSILCLILYMLIVYFMNKKPFVFSKGLIFGVVAVTGLLLPMLYVGSYDNADSRASSAEVLGKSLYSGRQEVWSEVIHSQDEVSIITGNSNTELFKSFPSESPHNMYLDISFQLGLPFLLSFLFILYVCVVRNKKLSKKTFASVIIILIYGFFETTFEAGNLNSMLMALAFINADFTNDDMVEE